MFIICLSNYIPVKNVSDVTNERGMLVVTKLVIVKDPTTHKDNYVCRFFPVLCVCFFAITTNECYYCCLIKKIITSLHSYPVDDNHWIQQKQS